MNIGWGLGLAVVLLCSGWLVVILLRRRTSRFSDRQADAGTLPDENVQFTVHCPREIVPDRWYPLLVFAHLASPSSDDPHSDPVAEVERQANQVLAEARPNYRSVTQDAMKPVPRHGVLTLVPEMEGIEFNPSTREYQWRESVHREQFQMRAVGEVPRTARGRLTVFLGRLIIGEVPLTVPVVSTTTAVINREVTKTTSRIYRSIFASYSRHDVNIVEEFERHVQATGDRYLRDLRDIRSGEEWSPRLEELIRTADIFQLFWSWNSLESPFVRKEWEYALSLNRRTFVRPVYWESPFPETTDLPPAALRSLNFYQLPAQHERARDSAPTAGMTSRRWQAALVSTAAVGILAAIAVPNLLRSRASGNEASAIGQMRAIQAAQADYAGMADGLYGSPDCLRETAKCIPGYQGSPIFDAAPIKSGYIYAFQATDETTAPASRALGYKSFVITAVPEKLGETGNRTFCTDATFRICQWSDGSKPVVINGRCDPSCRSLQ